MANIDVQSLGTNILGAIKAKLETHWKDVAPYATAEAQKLATTAAQIQLGIADESISPQHAPILLQMQANASQAALTAVETVGLIAAQDAINAALDVLRQAVNS